MNFNTSFIDQFSCSSEPFPVELTKACDWLGVIDRYEVRYETLRMVRTYFEENIDYETRGTLYFLTVSCLQELAMIAPTPEGKAARLYFLECERRTKSVTGDRSCEQSPPKTVPLVVPTDAKLHAMRTREQEKMELAALPVWDKNIPVYRRATDIVHDLAPRTKEEPENIDW